MNSEEIKTRCPSCRSQSLFVGKGGHLTCSVIGCKEPVVGRATNELIAEVERLTDKLDFTVRAVLEGEVAYEKTYKRMLAEAELSIKVDVALSKSRNEVEHLNRENEGLRLSLDINQNVEHGTITRLKVEVGRLKGDVCKLVLSGQDGDIVIAGLRVEVEALEADNKALRQGVEFVVPPASEPEEIKVVDCKCVREIYVCAAHSLVNSLKGPALPTKPPSDPE